MKHKLPANSFYVAEDRHRPRLPFGDKATESYYRLLTLLCPKVEGDPLDYGFGYGARRRELGIVPKIGDFYPRGTFATIHTGPMAHQRALGDLFNGMLIAIETAHKAGVEEGRNLLLGLARGDLTSDQAHGLAPIAKPDDE